MGWGGGVVSCRWEGEVVELNRVWWRVWGGEG